MDIIMKRLFTILACFLLLSCVSSKSFEELERRVTTLQDEKMMEEAAGVAGGMRIRGFYGLTSADAGPGFNLAAKPTVAGAASDYDLAIGRDVDGNALMYYFLSTSTTAESLPRIVRPIDRAATDGRWILITRFYAQEFYSDVDDGEHMFNVSNSDDPTYSGPTDWDMVVNRTEEWFGYYDVTDAEWVKFRHGKTYNQSTTGNLPYSVHWGGVVTNEGATGLITYNLQPAEKDMQITFFLLAGTNRIVVNPDDADKFVQAGEGALVNGDALESNPAANGYFMTIKAIENGSGNYDWASFPDNAGQWDDVN
jgi:hypothetical protein